MLKKKTVLGQFSSTIKQQMLKNITVLGQFSPTVLYNNRC